MEDLSTDRLGFENQAAEISTEEINQPTYNENQESIAEKKQTFEKNKEDNLRRMREAHEQEKKALSERINQLEQQVKGTQGLGEEDLVEGRHLNSIKQEMELMRRKMEETHQKSQELSDETRLKSQYVDLYSVVNEENLNKLKDMDPVLHATILNAPNLYARGHLAYQSIKKWGISEAKEAQDKMDHNLAKPSVGHAAKPFDHVDNYKNYMSEDDKKAKWEEVKRYIRGI